MKHRNQKRLSSSMIGLLVSLAVIGLFTFTRELPSLRRYLRIRSM
jgi:hypothetical protein